MVLNPSDSSLASKWLDGLQTLKKLSLSPVDFNRVKTRRRLDKLFEPFQHPRSRCAEQFQEGRIVHSSANCWTPNFPSAICDAASAPEVDLVLTQLQVVCDYSEISSGLRLALQECHAPLIGCPMKYFPILTHIFHFQIAVYRPRMKRDLRCSQDHSQCGDPLEKGPQDAGPAIDCHECLSSARRTYEMSLASATWSMQNADQPAAAAIIAPNTQKTSLNGAKTHLR